MAIRLARYDADDETGGPDVQLILSYLRVLPNAPNDNVQSIGGVLEGKNEIVMIDDVRKTVARLSVMPVAQEVSIPWWLPRAAWKRNNMAELVPVMGAACDEVLRRWDGSSTWVLYGDFQGAGDTKSDAKQNSADIANAWKDFFGADVATADSPQNPTRMARAHSTVGAIAALARRLLRF